MKLRHPEGGRIEVGEVTEAETNAAVMLIRAGWEIVPKPPPSWDRSVPVVGSTKVGYRP